MLRRTFAIDVLACPTCDGRMKLVAMITGPLPTRPVAAHGVTCRAPIGDRLSTGECQQV
ncbi:uncharacterized protein SOCEGT47_081070 [Sorangium cellulosum]|uniref:Uncharacterized protein n=1 Tax=Sorangium cellulosum TaxID=56 RepID=A0A4P2QDQ4_SORCE|nr:uncharacterized protein SOCEGT47_081070 [Sorangium cellulosum]